MDLGSAQAGKREVPSVTEAKLLLQSPYYFEDSRTQKRRAAGQSAIGKAAAAAALRTAAVARKHG